MGQHDTMRPGLSEVSRPKPGASSSLSAASKRNARYCAFCPRLCRFSCPVAIADHSETLTPSAKMALVHLMQARRSRGRALSRREEWTLPMHPLRPAARVFGRETEEHSPFRYFGNCRNTKSLILHPASAGEARPALAHFTPHSIAATLYACTSCLHCTEYCEHGIRPPDALAEVRELDVVRSSAPEGVGQALDAFVATGNPYRLESHPDLKEFAATPERLRGSDVIFFAGCTAAVHLPDTVRNFLRAAGPGGKVAPLADASLCCGYNALLLGRREIFVRLARRLADAVAHARLVVCACPTCAYAMREVFPKHGIRLNSEILHATEFLAGLFPAGAQAPNSSLPAVAEAKARPQTPDPKPQTPDSKLQLARRSGSEGGTRDSRLQTPNHEVTPRRVAYHDPCYLARHLGVTDAPRRLLAAAGIDVVELPWSGRDTVCCGAGGGMQFSRPELAKKAAMMRLREVAESGADTLATACPTCHVWLSRCARDSGVGLHTTDLVDLIAKWPWLTS